MSLAETGFVLAYKSFSPMNFFRMTEVKFFFNRLVYFLRYFDSFVLFLCCKTKISLNEKDTAIIFLLNFLRWNFRSEQDRTK